MNTTTKAQRTNKRQDAIWEKAMNTKTKQAETAAAAPEAPLGRCPKCNQPLRYYDGCLGYEAARCDACTFERDLNAKANRNPIEGEFAPADKSAHTPRSLVVVQTIKTEAHHADYSRPLDVQWLCHKHHGLTWRKAEGSAQ